MVTQCHGWLLLDAGLQTRQDLLQLLLLSADQIQLTVKPEGEGGGATAEPQQRGCGSGGLQVVV